MTIDDFKAAEDVPTNLNNLIRKCRAVTRPWNVTVGSEWGSFSNSLTPMRQVTRWFRRQWLLHICVFGAFLAVLGSLTEQLVMQLERCNWRSRHFVLEEMERWVIKSRKGITDPPAHNKEWLICRLNSRGWRQSSQSNNCSSLSDVLLWGLRRVRGLKHPSHSLVC